MPQRSPHAHRGFEVAEVTDARALSELRPEWLALWERASTTTPFQSPDWLVPWWECLGSGELLLFTLRQYERLVGVAPFCVYRDPESGRRELVLLGTGISDYPDILLDDQCARDGAAAVLGVLAECADRWDAADLQQLREGSALLQAPTPSDLFDTREAQESCPVLELPSSTHELPEVVPRQMTESLRYLRRRLERHGHADLETVTPHSLNSLLDALFALHGARWATRAMSGVLGDNVVQEFHRRAAHGLLDRGVLRLYALRLDGQVIAVLYGFLHRRRAYYYIGGFDPAYARLSPGTLIIGHAIEEAVRAGAEEFDFLRGREPYKYRWGAVDRPAWRRRLLHTASPAAAAGAHQ